MAASAIAIPRHISPPHLAKDLSSISPKMDKLSSSQQPDSTISCDKCQTLLSKTYSKSLCTSCEAADPIPVDPLQSRKRKFEGKVRDSDDLKRKSIPSPVSSPGHSPRPVESALEDMASSIGRGTISDDHAVYIGSTTELEPALFSLLDMSHLSGQPLSFLERGGSLFALDHELAVRSSTSRIQATRRIVGSVGSLGPVLIDLYIKHVHYSFPIITDDFLAAARRGTADELDPTLIAAIYTISSPWLEPKDVPLLANLDNIAFALFTKMLHAPSIHIVQAGLLLMQRPDVDSKTLNSQVVGAAYEIGLHLDCSSWTITESEKSLRRRLAWALYMQDTWSSLIHGRPAWIDRSNWAVQDLSDEDFRGTESMQSVDVNGHLLFLQLVNLTRILSSILDTFYTLKAIQEVEQQGAGSTRFILERAKPVQLRLKNWFAGLAPVLKMDATESDRPLAIGLLHLAYFATEITLHRCIIRSLEVSNSDAYLTYICRSAAKTRLISAMDFVNRLRLEHLKSFWYFPAPVSFALIASFGSLLLATAPSMEEQEFYKTRLGEYRWTVGVSSRIAPFLSLALQTLDNSEKLLRNLPAKPPSVDLAMAMPEPIPLPQFNAPGEDDSEEDEDDDTTPPDMEMLGNSGLMSPSMSTEGDQAFFGNVIDLQ